MSTRSVKVCHDEVEARFYAEYLAAEGFAAEVVVFAQQGVYGTAPVLASAEVVVPEGDHARATQALREAPPFEIEPHGTVADARAGGDCPAHGVAPSVPCARCGTFVCPECVAAEERPLCDDCDQKAFGELRQRYNRRDSRANRAAVLFVALVAGVIGLGVSGAC